ncbi:MAG TPA: hypothetical protein PLT91_04665 [Clostridia bacterium]|jgi:hypothetical protein|nr:MAG: hypothetical protein BWX97_01024 [Firmicutes bacterium ADurb.Bin146]HOD93240.1 hypothetical protein [Clostridia bacterium]HQM39514.1 hypothetical protein [Clostridia bacterium]
MLVEFLGAVITQNGRYLVEPIENNEKMYVRFPRIETVNAIAEKEEILEYGLKMKYGIEIMVNDCIYQEDFTDKSDVVSYAYFSVYMHGCKLPSQMLWIEKEDLSRVNFVIEDSIITDIILNSDKKEAFNVQDISCVEKRR